MVYFKYYIFRDTVKNKKTLGKEDSVKYLKTNYFLVNAKKKKLSNYNMAE
jgi:hypothetical protein